MFWAEDKFRTVMNREAFTNFNNEQDAYFFGLLLSDGNVAKDRARIKLVLKQSDRHILEEFRSYLDCTVDIKDYLASGKYASSAFIFSSKELKQRLEDQNLTSAKSTKEKLPNFDWKHNRHFWRGVVDGDGSLFFASKTKPMLSLVGSEEVVKGFGEFVFTNLAIPVKTVTPHTISKSAMYVTYSGYEAVSVAKLLYEGAQTKLNRKFSVYQEFLKYSRANNTSGKVGVSFCKSKNKFVSSIKVDGKYISLGNYPLFEDAVAAREAAELKYFGRLKGN